MGTQVVMSGGQHQGSPQLHSKDDRRQGAREGAPRSGGLGASTVEMTIVEIH